MTHTIEKTVNFHQSEGEDSRKRKMRRALDFISQDLLVLILKQKTSPTTVKPLVFQRSSSKDACRMVLECEVPDA